MASHVNSSSAELTVMDWRWPLSLSREHIQHTPRRRVIRSWHRKRRVQLWLWSLAKHWRRYFVRPTLATQVHCNRPVWRWPLPRVRLVLNIWRLVFRRHSHSLAVRLSLIAAVVQIEHTVERWRGQRRHAVACPAMDNPLARESFAGSPANIKRISFSVLYR